MVIKMWCCYRKAGYIHRQNRFESPEIKPHIYGQPFSSLVPRSLNEGRIVFLTNGDEINDNHMQKKEVGPHIWKLTQNGWKP